MKAFRGGVDTNQEKPSAPLMTSQMPEFGFQEKQTNVSKMKTAKGPKLPIRSSCPEASCWTATQKEAEASVPNTQQQHHRFILDWFKACRRRLAREAEVGRCVPLSPPPPPPTPLQPR